MLSAELINVILFNVEAIKVRLVKILLLFFWCLSSAPIYARDTLSNSCGLIVNAGNNNYLYYSDGRVKELLLNRNGKGLMAKTHSCACISYLGTDNKIQRINNVSFSHRGSCYKETGNVYASDYAYGKTPSKLSADKGNKVYLAYNYIPDRENRFFFFYNEMTTFYIFEKYGSFYIKSEVCTQNKKAMHCRKYYESGSEIGRLSEEKIYINMHGNYIEQGGNILYDSGGQVTIAKTKNRDHKRVKVLFNKSTQRAK